ncbi:MAG TPA: Ig-like domain-containing protein, partial [Methylomirabilota bacterium]|nr:Ig-like domain-containing protein [Methylomirabilota bacterium]
AAVPRNARGEPRTDVSLSWKSADPAVATVDAAGLVRAAKPGRAVIRVSAQDASSEVPVVVAADTVARFSIDPETTSARTGDVVHFHAQPKNASGASVPAQVEWSVEGDGAQVWPDGGFVAEKPGTYTVRAAAGPHVAAAGITVTPRAITRSVEVVGHIFPKEKEKDKEVQFAEEWIWDHYAYLSSISDKVYPYDISDPAHPQPGEVLKVDARLVNDVSTTPDGKIGVITREGASSRKNGIVFLDTSDPMHPKVISEYTATVTGGVHSAYINSHYVYLTDDASGSMRVIDFADVKNPKEVARWETESGHMNISTPEGAEIAGRFLHDLQIVDGLAYLAYWRDGLIVLDVGNGVKGGSPEHPRLVSQCKFNFDELYGPGWLAGTHAVYRYKNYVFLGDEVFPAMFNLASRSRVAVRGIAHVVDVSDILHPREVATYSVPEAGAHNIWVFDDVMYMGYYSGGGRVVDVSGELRGELYNQGREIARIATGDPEGYRPNLPFAWGAFPHKGLIYVNDVHSGIWIVKLGKLRPYTATTETPD